MAAPAGGADESLPPAPLGGALGSGGGDDPAQTGTILEAPPVALAPIEVAATAPTPAYCINCGAAVELGELLCADCAPQPSEQEEAIGAAPADRPVPDVPVTVPDAPVTVPDAPVTPSSAPVPATHAASDPGRGEGAGEKPASLRVDMSWFSPAVRRNLAEGAAVLVGLYLATVLVSLLALPFIHGYSAADALRGAGWLTGLTFRGHLMASGSVGGSASATIGAYAQPGLLFAAALAAVAVLARRSELRRRSRDLRDLAATAATLGAGAAVAAALIAIVTAGSVTSSTDGSAARYHVNIVSALLGTFFFTAVAAGAARLATSWRTLLTPERSRSAADWVVKAELPTIGALVAIGGVLATLGVVLVLAIGRAPMSAWLIVVLDLPFVLLESLLLSVGVPLSTSGSLSAFGFLQGSVGGSVGLLSGGMPAYAWLLLLIPVLSIGLAGVRSTVRRPLEPSLPWLRVGRLALLGAVGGWLVSFLTSILAGGSAGTDLLSGSGTVRFGMNVFGSLVGGAVLAGLVPLSGFYVARLLGSRAPLLVASIASFGGGTLDEQWRQALHLPERSGGPAAAWAPGRGAGGGFRITPRVKVALYSGGGLVALVVAAVVALKIVGSSYTPAAAAQGYLSALASGDAQAVLGASDGRWSGPWLTQAALRRQDARAPIGAIHVGTASVDGAAATVPVSYSVGGTPVRTTLSLRRSGSRDLFFANWVVTDPVGTLNISGTGVSVDGAPVPAGTSAVFVFPGRPALGATQGSDPNLVTSLDQSEPAPVAPGQSAEIRTSTELSPIGQRSVLAAVATALQHCAASSSLTPAGCPFADQFAASWHQNVSGVQWTLSGLPTASNTTLTLNPDHSVTVQAADGAVSASCSYTYDDGFGPQTSTDNDVASITSATVSLVSGQPPSVSFQTSPF